MTTSTLFAPPRFTPVDGNGLAMPGAQLFFWQTGTSTPQNTFSDSGLTTPNTNPVIADGNGLFGPIYLGTTAYKVQLQTAASVTVWTVDPYIVATTSSFSGFAVMRRTVFAGSGVYTPNANMLFCEIEAWGGGAGGGGTANSAGVEGVGGGGGGAGSKSKLMASAVTIGVSQAVTIGAKGTGGASGNNPGTAGAQTSVGILCIAKGGSPGSGAPAAGVSTGGLGGVAGTGDVAGTGMAGQPSQAFSNEGPISGAGGSTEWGGGGRAIATQTLANGETATGFGAGGSGGASYNTAGATSGGDGTPGLVIITEYCSA